MLLQSTNKGTRPHAATTSQEPIRFFYPVFGLDVDYDQEMAALKEQEQELEHLRALLRPEHWPRIYELLRRVREEIRRLETSDPSSDRDIA